MKITVIFLVVSFAVLLALPEVIGAPSTTCDKKGKSDDFISKATEKESSKVSQRSVSEETDTESEHNRASNGLVSGKKELSVSREMNAAELEKSRSASETKTATGSEKVEESAKKKTLISANQKKSVVIYYLVSYKRLPVLRSGETKEAYYKRVFPKEKNIKVFYHKVFKVYEEEEPAQYIARIEYIFDKVYPDLDPRLDVRYADFFDHYYTQKYCRKVDEKDDHYYARVLKRFDDEPFDRYKKRMACLETSLDEEDFAHVTFVDNETGFKVGERKTPRKSVSSPSSSGIKKGNFKSVSKKSKKEASTLDKSQSEEKEKDKNGSSVKAQRKLKSTKEVIEKEEEIKCFSYKVAYTKLPKKTVGQRDEDYYKAFFGEYNPKMTADERNELYLRILIQYKGEDVTEYVQRIDFLFDKVYPKLDIRTNRLLVSMLEHYYREKYLKKTGETEVQWLSRVLKKEPKETVEHYKDRFYCLETVFMDDVDWSQVVVDANSKTGFKLKQKAKKTSAKTKSCSS